MTMDCTFSVDGETLTVVVSGTNVCSEDVRGLVDDITVEASKDGLLRVLCDAASVHHTLTHLEVLDVAKHAVRHVPSGGRLAVVHGRDDREKASFMETVIVHLGKPARVFSSPTAARTWLDSAPALERA